MNIELTKNALFYDIPKFLKQRIVNEIVENGIGTYKYKKEPELIQLKNKSIDDKIMECINNDPLTIKIFDLLEISKGYKYSVVFDYNSLDVDLMKKNCINIESEYYKEIGDSIDELNELYLEDEQHFYIKFHKKISILDKSENPQWHNVRYPMLVVIHKDSNIFEVRFDRINTDNKKGYYKTAIDVCLAWLKNNCDLNCKYVNLDEIIRYIVDKYPDAVTELIWAGELAKSQGITLKAGEDMIMPFFGTLKVKISEWRKNYENKKDALECLDELESYLDKTKKYANDQFRTLRVIKYEKDGNYIELDEKIDLRVTFNYGKTTLDLINIYDNEINDMERMDYVINFIAKAREYFRKL